MTRPCLIPTTKTNITATGSVISVAFTVVLTAWLTIGRIGQTTDTISGKKPVADSALVSTSSLLSPTPDSYFCHRPSRV